MSGRAANQAALTGARTEPAHAPAEGHLAVMVFAPQLPWPPTQGAAIRNFHVIRALARSHRVTLLAFGDPDAEPGPLEALGVEVVAVPEPPARTRARRLSELASTTQPDLARRLASETMFATARLKMILDGPYDVVHVEGLEMAPYGLDVLRATPAGQRARLVYDAHNAEWLLQRRTFETDRLERRRWPAAFYSAVQTWKLRRFEGRVLRAAWLTAAVSQADADALHELVPDARIVVAPNGVDTRLYSPPDDPAEDSDLVVFTGKMDYRPNVDAAVWFASEVWPLVIRGRPAARFAIVGRDPAPAVRALADQPGVLVTGPVDDVRPWLARAGVVVAPLRVAGGTRLKVLEAMSMAKAVVATSQACEGIAVEPPDEIAVADDPREMAAQILALLDDVPRRRAMGAAARRRMEFQYRWEQVGWELEAAIRRLSGQPA